jgi:hypothetical protein
MFKGKSFLWIGVGKPARRTALLLGVATLVFLTVLAALPINVVGPFDARTYEPVTGVRVDYSSVGAALEPMMALAHIIAGGPDVRAAAISIPIWIVVLATCTAAIRQLYQSRWRASWRTLGHSAAAAGRGLFFLTIYCFFILLVRVPNWRATALDSNLVLADLHAHTFGSHDGLISARDNLRWQAQRGCSVVGIVEHDSPQGSLEAARLSASDASLPPVLAGVEINQVKVGYLAAIALPERFEQHPLAQCRGSFIPWFHQNCRGVVLALRYHLKPNEVEHYVESGIDGFDIASDGHPDSAAPVQQLVLAAGRVHHLPLVAWTDWHGVSGILRTWTAFRVPNAARLPRPARAAAVLDALRRHDCANIIPLVVGRMRQVSLAEAILAPFTETVRYAIGLSPLRVLAWWVWGMALFLTATALLRLGVSPAPLILAVALVAMGVAISVQALRLIIAHLSGQAPFVFQFRVGLAALGAGIAAAVSGALSGWGAVARRQRWTQPPEAPCAPGC